MSIFFTETPTYQGSWGLHCGDALKELSKLPSSSVRCFVTSPPYYCQVDYGVSGQYGQEATPGAYVYQQARVAAEMLRVASPDANLFFVVRDSHNFSGGTGGDSRNSDGTYKRLRQRGPRDITVPRKAQLLIPERLRIAFARVGWLPISAVIWDRPDVRRYAADRPGHNYEHVLIFAKSPDHYWNIQAVRRESSRDTLNGSPLDAVWTLSKGNQPEVMVDGKLARGRASFPLRLAEMCVLLGSAPGDLVCDPYSGMGTTGLAAFRWGRNYLGIDLNGQDLAASWQMLASMKKEQRERPRGVSAV